MLQRMLVSVAAMVVSVAPGLAGAEGAPIDIAQSYFMAMDAGDLDRAEALFASESSIFETGGVEGSWKEYRSHHIGPELASIDTFKTTLGDPEAFKSEDGSMAVVTWPIEYRIRLKDERLIQSKGTVTFVLVGEDEGYRIRHLHWSSRRKKTE